MVTSDQQLEIRIRPFADEDADSVWETLEPVIRAGETYALDKGICKADALAYWLSHDAVFVVEDKGKLLGTYYLTANYKGGGAHVANCGYVVAHWAQGRGIARAMCLHSLSEAAARNFLSMQFNFVVSSNERAVKLWQSLGFEIVGRLPDAFLHPTLGFVDAFVMYIKLASSKQTRFKAMEQLTAMDEDQGIALSD